MRIRSLGFFCLIAGLAAAPAVFAQSTTFESIPVDQTGCTGTVCGTMNGFGVTYTGVDYGFQTNAPGQYNFFTLNTATYTFVGAPSDPSIVATGVQSGLQSLSFSQPGGVSGLILDIVSLGGGNGATTTYDFNTPFVVLSCGSDNWGGGCGSYTVGSAGTSDGAGGYYVSGDEWSGTIEFAGAPTSISFNVTDPENWAGFDPGILTPAATPEPSSLALLGTGVLGAAGVLRRRLVRK